MTEEERALWARCKAGDVDALNRLVEAHLPVVRRAVGRQRGAFPDADSDDLFSHGVLGLIEAVERFEPGPVPFPGFAWSRIIGAIHDEERRRSGVSRLVRSRRRALDREVELIQTRLGRAPTIDEVAEGLEVSLDQVRSWLADDNLEPVSLAAPIRKHSRTEHAAVEITRGDLLEAHGRPDDGLAVLDISERLAAAIDALSERSRVILHLRYRTGLTTKETGRVLGVSTTRVSVLQTAALRELGDRLSS